MSEITGNAYVVDPNEPATTMVDPAAEPHIVIQMDRTVDVPEELREIAVQFDHNIETVTFDCPRYWDGHDFSEMRVYINYMCADGAKGQYTCTSVSTDEDTIHFDWCLSNTVTCAKGILSFLVCIKKVDDNGELVNHWSSRLNQEMKVLEGLECPAEELISNPDVIEQILNRLDDLEQNGGGTSTGTSGGITKETDPTVPAWAKQPDPPKYTAADVGALAANDLSAAINTALAQAKASGEFDGEDGKSPVITITEHAPSLGGNDTVRYTITVTNPNGITSNVVIHDGSNGRGIASVALTSGNGAAGTTDTYTITYTDGTTSTFAVYNGKDGAPYVLTAADKSAIAAEAAGLVNVPVLSVNGKTGAVSIDAGDVNADPAGTASGAVTGHNVSEAAHNDIRLLITGLTNRLNALANSTDDDLDQLAEIVAYIKENKSLIDGITTSKVSAVDIIDNLTTNASNKPLSAKMGVQLKALIDAIKIPTALPASDVYDWAKQPSKPTYTASEVGAATAQQVADLSEAIADLETEFNNHKNNTTMHVTAAEKSKWNSNSGGGDSGDSVEILLPSELVAVVGVEFNIYYKSAIRANRTLDNFEIKCALNNTSIGYKLFSECFRLTAVDSEIGDYTLTVQVKDITSGTVKATKSVALHIIENRSLNPKNVLYIGDSLTFSRGGLYPAEIQYNLSNGSLSSIGTQSGTKDSNGIGAVKHEGYNGATVGGFLAATVTSGNTNKFYNPSTGEFDLSYFLSNLGETQLDAVCLNLGHNNIGNHVNAVSGLTTIAAKIHEYDPDIPVIISLIEPLAGQDGWTAKTKSTAAEMRRHWKNLISAYITAFDNEKISNVYLSTPYLNIDADNDFPTENVARSARDTTQIVRQNDAMHPNKIGTLKMADAYYAYLLYRIPEDDAVYYSVTNNLTNVSTNNSAQSVKQGTSYSAVLTPADGYTLDTVTVTMGGNPVTVTNGIINISAVTGNIIITATASVAETPSVPNLVDPSTANDASPDTTTFFKDEWVNGYYISSSSLSAKTGCITTNLFPIAKGQKIKIEGILVETSEHRTRNRWKVFNSDGTAAYSSYLNFLSGEVANGTTGETSYDAATNTAIIDTSGLNSAFNNIAWARFSCYPAGDNDDLIVSVVE